MSRPFIDCSIDQLETHFSAGMAAHDQQKLALIETELQHRKTARAGELHRILKAELASLQGQPVKPATKTHSGKTGGAQSSPSSAKVKRKISPTPEQSEAIDHFKSAASLKINAYAGSGKTSTLEMLAHSTNRRGQYIAFNRDIVREAKEKFPNRVNCSTTHGLAFKAMAPTFGGGNDKMVGKFNANQLAEILGLTKNWRLDEKHTLLPRSQAFLIIETIKKYAQSSDPDICAHHVPRHGSLVAAPPETMALAVDFAMRGARHVWGRMASPADALPLGHDGYLKLWALGDPQIAADFILLDEAQDTNPVVLGVLERQPAQMVYVGDKYQQIYEWRGAVNAMEKIQTGQTTYLTTSFRFGSEYANLASQVLRSLGEHKPVTGNRQVASKLAAAGRGATILARTNAATISAVITALDENQKPHLIGGNAELMDLLRGVQDLKSGQPSTVPDFFGFNTWQELVEFSGSGEGEHLRTFVKLVVERGEKQLMWALNRTVDHDQADLVISTAHKSKGREWPQVKLMDDFMKSKPRTAKPGTGSVEADPAELRLLYVALTRAKETLDVPTTVLDLLAGKAPSERTVSNGSPKKAPPAPGGRRPGPGGAVIEPFQPPTSYVPPGKPQPIRRPGAQPGPSPSNAAAQRTPAPKKKGFMSWLFGD